MIGTLSLAGWMLGLYYALRAGGPVGIFRALRDPNVPTWTKVLLALCALPIPGRRTSCSPPTCSVGSRPSDPKPFSRSLLPAGRPGWGGGSPRG